MIVQTFAADGALTTGFGVIELGWGKMSRFSGRMRSGRAAGVAVDSSHLYWANAGDGTISEAGLDGSNPQAIVTGQENPNGVAVDSSHLYWANEFAGFSPGTINEAGLDGSNPHAIVTGQGEPFGVAVGPQ